MTELHSYNPATGALVYSGKEATSAEVQETVKRAKKALIAYRKSSFDERVKYLEAFSMLLDDQFAMCISEEMGKPLWESKQEVISMKNKIAISIQAYKERSFIKVEKETITQHKPHGVVAIFGPFNFPGHLPHGHIVPALLAGNTVIFKPSELAPKVGEMMVSLWEKTGLPDGVMSLIQGGRHVAEMLLQEADIHGVFFTGSAQAGKAIMQASLPFPNRIVALEMGGNNPLIVRASSDCKASVYLTIQSAFLTSGQRCTAARRLILIENDHSEHFLSSLIQSVKKLMVAPFTTHPEPYMGPLVSAQAASKVFTAYETLLKKGAIPLVAMSRPEPEGAFITPSIVDVTKIETADEEIFGPLLQVVRVKDLDDAIKQANNTAYGLSAGIISVDKSDYEKVQEEVHAGIINWNTPLTGASSQAPFGGIGLSGNFRPAGYYSCDYCSYPVASTIKSTITLPESFPPGLQEAL